MSNTETFQHIGKRVEFGDVALTPEDVALFRLTALQGVRIRKFARTDTQTALLVSSFTDGVIAPRDAAADYSVYSSAFYSKSVMESDPDYARSTITFARFNDKNRNTKIYNIYDVESFEGETVMAAHRVRVIRDLSRIAFSEEGEPYEDVYSRQRKGYETPMTSKDVANVAHLVDRITTRARITGGH